MGSNQPRSSHWGSLDFRGASSPHQLSRATWSLERCSSLLSEEGECNCINLVGQFQCSGICQLYGLFNAGLHWHPILDVSSAERYHSSSLAHSWCGQPDGGHNIEIDHQRRDGLAAEFSTFLKDCPMLGPFSCGHVRKQAVDSPSPNSIPGNQSQWQRLHMPFSRIG